MVNLIHNLQIFSWKIFWCEGQCENNPSLLLADVTTTPVSITHIVQPVTVRMIVLILCCVLPLPIIPASPIHGAVQRFRTNMNYINPIYRLATNIYQGNYRLAKHNRERRNQRQQQKKKKRRIKRKKVARRPRNSYAFK